MKLVHSGKVRDLYQLADGDLLLVASDRVSVYDVSLPTPVAHHRHARTGAPPRRARRADPRPTSRVERAADRRGVRDSAIIALLLYTGARVEECARLDTDDIALTRPHRASPPARQRRADTSVWDFVGLRV